jgi:hypothetical protein
VFSAWYFTVKFQQLSPDMFDGGFEAGRTDWLLGIALGVVMAVMVAHRIACSRDFCDPPIADVEKHPEAIPFHQTPAILFLIGLSGLYGIFVLDQSVFSIGSFLPTSLWYGLMSMLTYPLALIMLTQAIASLQLCWIRWRYRAQTVPWRLAALSRPAYYEGFAATLLLLAIGVPTLHAFSFVCWLMPWNIRALFGF